MRQEFLSELRGLEDNYRKLVIYIGSDEFRARPVKVQHMLVELRAHMDSYAAVLADLIDEVDD